MKPRYLIVSLLALGHLMLVIGGASHGALSPGGRIGEWLSWYSVYSGADTGYGFFAPGVGGDLRARFDVEYENGRKVTDTLEAGLNRELELRIGNIVGQAWQEDTDASLRRSLAASWAGKMFARHPGAISVTVRLDTYFLPDMESTRVGGPPPRWEPLYQATFRRSPAPENQRG